MTKRESRIAQHKALLQGALDVVRAAESANRDLTAEELATVSSKRAEAANAKAQLDAIDSLEAEVTRAGVISVHDNRQDKPFTSLGEQLIAVSRSTNGRNVDPRLLGIMERAAAGASEAVPSDGGFLVQTDFNAEILAKSFAAGQLVNKVVHQPISANANSYSQNVLDDSSRVTGSRGGGLQLYWASEAGAVSTATKPKFRKLQMELQKLYGLFYATDEVLQDAAALSALAEREFRKEFAFVFDDMIFRGSGVGQPLGFMNSPCLVTVAKETGQVATTIVTENVVKMYAAMYAAAANPVWLVNKNCFPQLLTLSIGIGAAGYPVYLPAGGISGKPYGTLFGDPVIQIEQAATLGALGDITYCDFGEYLWIEKGGIQSASSIHVNFLTDETAFRWTVRVNGQPVWNKPLTPYKGTASSIAPFVALAAR